MLRVGICLHLGRYVLIYKNVFHKVNYVTCKSGNGITFNQCDLSYNEMTFFAVVY